MDAEPTLADLSPPGRLCLLAPDDPVSLAIAAMADRALSAVVVAVDGRPTGLLTERQLLRLVARGAYRAEAPLHEVMSPAPVANPAQLDLAAGYARLAASGLGHLVLVDGQGRAQGVVSDADFARVLCDGSSGSLAPPRAPDGLAGPPWQGEACCSIEQQVFELLERLPVGIAAVDPAVGKIAFTNERFAQIMGYGQEHIRNLVPADLHPPKDVERVMAEFRKAARGEIATSLEIPMRRGDGSDFLAEIRNAFIDLNGRRYHLGLFTDITERKQAEAALREGEERYRTIFNSSADAILILDARGNLLAVNDQACRHFGLTREALLRRHIGELDTPGDAVHVPARLAELEREGSARFEAVHRDTAGRAIPVEVRAKRILFDGQPAFLSIVRDIAQRKAAEAALQESHRRLMAVMSAIDSIIYIADLNSYEILFLNPVGVRVFGPVEGQLCYRALQGLDAPCPFCTNDKLLNPDGSPAGLYQWEFQNRLDGRWYDLRDCALEWTDGRLVRMEIATDITERKRTEESLRESEERFRKLFEDSHLATVLQEGERCVAANVAVVRLLGLDGLEQVLGASIIEFSPGLQPDGQTSIGKAEEMVRTALEQGSNAFEWELVRADGARILTQVMMTSIRHGGRDLLHVVVIDITEQHRARKQIGFLAFNDPLTGLPNRVSCQARLAHEVERAGRSGAALAVLYLDLNKFKYINDTHGQALGDRLLQAVARRLGGHLRDGDTLCRLSGDEFLIMRRDTESAHPVSAVAGLCERVMAAVAEPFDLEGRQLFISVSIGVAFYPQDAGNSEALILNAHIALHEAKLAGHQTYRFFETRMNDELVAFVQTREALRVALERQELTLFYQPQIELRSGRVVGVEALLRWRCPGGGLTLPGGFLAVAEESGLIAPIGRWVLREACRQAAAWHTAGWSDLTMAVNLSAVQFRQGQVAADVLMALEESGLDPACLELELTESILLEPETAILETVAGWKARGIQLSIDDFGTGYSSLAYLRRFRVDKLKIDRSFVANLHRHEGDRAIVLAMIQIARSLNLRTVAEGVEDPVQAEQLKIMGCDEVQGFLYAKPLPPEELAAWLIARTPGAASRGG